MADPMLNEDRILAMLTDPACVLSPNGVRSLMSLVLMACYDRKVEREFMAEIIDLSADVGIIMSQLESAAKMRAALTTLKADVPTEKIDEQISVLAKSWSAKRAHMARKFDLVRQCPTSEDRVS